MKIGPVFRKIIYSSGFLAAIPAIVLLIFIHPLGSKYVLSVESDGVHNWQYLYDDLNSDSISEAVYTSKGIPYFFVGVKDYN